MTILAIETSCDETSAAIVRDGRILSNVVSSQTKLHAEYGGVVPELAAREHLKNLLPVAQIALSESKISAQELDAVAATHGTTVAAARGIQSVAAAKLSAPDGQRMVCASAISTATASGSIQGPCILGRNTSGRSSTQ